jgi:hypothetical protein
MNKNQLKIFYYDYIHWCIKLYIYQIRNKNYALDHWKTQLNESLKIKNKYCFLIKESENNQTITEGQLQIIFNP